MAERSTSKSTLDRDIVLTTAIELIELDGAAELTLTRIAAKLGVTQPALYNHVDGLDDIWRGIGLQMREELADALVEACMGLSGADAVRAVSHAWRSIGMERPALYQVTKRHPVAGDPDLEDAVDRVVNVLGAAVRGFGLDENQTVHAARTLRSALHGFVAFEVADGHPKPHEPDDTFEHLIEVLMVGFAALADGTITLDTIAPSATAASPETRS